MISERELKLRKETARKGFFIWHKKVIIAVLMLALYEALFIMLTDRPWSTGNALLFFIAFLLALWLVLRIADRYQIVGGLGHVWGALHLQRKEMPPSADLLYALDELRGAIVTYARSSLGYYSVSDLHVPRLRRDIDLSFVLIAELLHKTVWKPNDLFRVEPEPSSDSAVPEPPYGFLLSWTDGISNQLLGSRDKNPLFENRILALSYFFDDTIMYFRTAHTNLAELCTSMVNEATLKQQERRRQFSALRRDLLITVGGAAATCILTYILQ